MTKYAPSHDKSEAFPLHNPWQAEQAMKHDSLIAQPCKKKPTCDAFVDKHNELEKQRNVVTQVRCQYQMVGERH